MTKTKVIGRVVASVSVGVMFWLGPLVHAAPDDDWKPLRIGAGGWVTGIAISGDGTKVIRTDTYGGYIWGDVQWEQLVTSGRMPEEYVDVDKHAGVYAISIAPGNSNIIYMSYRGFVFKSINKGTTFTRTNFQESSMDANDGYRTSGQKIAIDPANTDVVYAGAPTDGLYETDDGGDSWARVSDIPTPSPTNEAGITGIIFDPTSGTTGGRTNTVYAASWGNGVYISTNAGSSWSSISGGPPYVREAIVASDGSAYFTDPDNDILWKYDGSWTSYPDVTGNSIASIAVDPNDSDRLIVGTVGGAINQSLDGGATWTGWYHDWGPAGPTRVATDIPWLAWTNEGWMSNGGMMFDPVEPNKLWFAEGIGVWYSNPPYTFDPFDWISQSKGIEQLVANEIMALPGGHIVAASWDRPIFYSNDANVFPSVHQPDNEHSIVHGWSIDHASSDPSFIAGHLSWWGRAKSGYSLDYGQTWNQFPTMPSTKMGGSLATATPDNIVWAFSSRGNVYYTKDRGQTWHLTDLPQDGYGFQYYLNRHIVAADRVNIGTFYIYHQPNGVYRSTDGGDSWSLIYSGEVSPSSAYNAKMDVVPGKAGHLFFTSGHSGGATNPASNGYFKRSIDGGVTWTTIPDVLEVYTFGFGKEAPGSNYPAIYIVGWVNNEYGIWRSDDEAQTWIQIGKWPNGTLDRPVTIDGDKDVYGKVYVGLAGSGYVYYESLPDEGTSPPIAPSALQATVVSATRVELTWIDNATNEDAFIVERSPDGTQWNTLVTLGPDVAGHADEQVWPASTYYYRVYASNSGGNSEAVYDGPVTTPAEEDPLPPPPAAPSALEATAVSSSRVELAWTDNALNEDIFVVERSPDSTSWIVLAILGTDVIGHMDDQVLPASSYTYRVHASNAGGNSEAVYDGPVTTPPIAPPFGVINFNSYSPATYLAGQDITGTVTVENGGSTLYLEGNRWQQIGYPYDITSNTVLEFDFQSNAQGEIHGIGFDDDLRMSLNRMFTVYGTQSWGLLDFDDYSGDGSVKHYVIPVGQFYTGPMQYLFFVMDHDVSSPTGQSRFSNVRVYENGEAPQITSTARTTATVGQPYIYDAVNNDNTIEATGVPAPAFSRTSGSIEFQVSASGVVTWTPTAVGSYPIEITADNGISPNNTQSFTVVVSEAPIGVINFNSYSPATYLAGQDITGTVTVENGGSTLYLEGNRWQQIGYPYDITSNTVLEFDFQSNAQGEIHGIGFDDDLRMSLNRMFTVYGTQSWGLLDFDDYSGDGSVKHYVIPVGQFYTGPMQYLFFVMDHDVSSPTGQSRFSNVRVY